MWAKASISPLFELAREAREAEPVGAADRPHIHRPFLPIVPRRDQGFWVMIRGSSPSGAEHRPHPCIRWIHPDPNHDAVMRIGGKDRKSTRLNSSHPSISY